MRVCLVSREFQPLGAAGGIGTYTWNLSRGLHSLGCQVEVVTHARASAPISLLPRFRVWPVRPVLPASGLLKRALPPDVTWRLAYSFGVAATLQALTREEPVALVEAPEWGAESLVYSFHRNRSPLVVRLHTPQWLVDRANGVPLSAASRLTAWVETQGIRRADAVSTPSANLAEDVLGPRRIRPRRLSLLPNPVDTDLFKPDSSQPRDGPLLFVGRFERRKGPDVLARAFPLVRRRHPNARLRLIGRDTPTGPGGSSYKDYLVAELTTSGCLDSVEFLDWMSPEELVKHYRASRICVIPSRYEAFGYTCLEAMSCGRPVVCSLTGGLAEWVRDRETGVLVQPGNAEMLADAINGLLGDDALRVRIAFQAREQAVKDLALVAVAERALALYRTVIEAR